jgi:hypothetical protein
MRKGQKKSLDGCHCQERKLRIFEKKKKIEIPSFACDMILFHEILLYLTQKMKNSNHGRRYISWV